MTERMKGEFAVSTMQALGSQTPDPTSAPRGRHLSITDMNLTAGDDTVLFSTVLPAELVVSIFADRLQVRTLLSVSSDLSLIVLL